MTYFEVVRRGLAVHRTALLLLIVLFAIVLFSVTADEPFHLDNMDFPAVAKQTSITGIPVYYRGEDNPNHNGLYHPPLYIYTLAAWIRLFGFGEVQVRMLGLVCALIQAGLVLAMVRTLLGRTLAIRIGPWFAAVFLLNPYTLRTASIADIDSTIYGPLLCGILLCTLRLNWRNGQWRTDDIATHEYSVLWLLIVLALWSKLTTVLLLFVALPFLFASRLGWRRAVTTSFLITIAGIVGFLASYWIYGAVTGLDASYSIKFTIYSFLTRGSSGRTGVIGRILDRGDNFLAMAPIHVSWTGLFPWIVSSVACLFYLWLGFKRKNALYTHIGLILGVALATTAYYCGQTLSFGGAPFKYPYVYWGLIVVAPFLLAHLLYGSMQIVSRGWSAILATAVFGIALYGSCTILRDGLILGATDASYRWIWRAPAILVIVSLAAVKWKDASRSLFAASLSAYLGLNLGIALHHARVPYSTTYDYGQLGFADTVAFIRSNTLPGALIVSMKDIGFAADRRYIENYGAIHEDPATAQRLLDTIGSGKAEYAVFTEDRGQDQLIVNPGMKRWIEENTRLVRSFGHYRIYQRKQP